MRDIFANVNDWLRFAETKNGALVAFNSAVAFGVLRLVLGDQNLATWLVGSLLVSATFALISISIALYTFLPKLTPTFISVEETPSSADNLLFYGHIAKYTTNSYLTALVTHFQLSEEISPYAKQLAEQIVINAQIASWKYQLFSVALRFSLLTIFTPMLTTLAVLVTQI